MVGIMKKRVQVLLEEKAIEILTKEAKEKGLSISSLIRLKLIESKEKLSK